MNWSGIGITLLAIVVGELITKLFSKWLLKYKRGSDFVPFFATLFRFGYLFTATAIFLDAIGVDVQGVFLGAGGILGFIIGFAFKDFLSNVSAGLWMLIVDPFDVGDYIEVAGVKGTVEEITALSLVLKTEDGERVFVSNSLAWGKPIKVRKNS